MPVFVYCIAADIEAPPEGMGYVRAETAEEAVALIGHPERTCIRYRLIRRGRANRARESIPGSERRAGAPSPPPLAGGANPTLAKSVKNSTNERNLPMLHNLTPSHSISKFKQMLLGHCSHKLRMHQP